ncbi:DUF4373 domain-containing protein [Granulicatella sp. zg-ZJ]|uniref:DUF4373 domain-containing protein n=1 Tax=Granulicatella sp. zg-ZJ TaxID=2678504 RepID=UPI0013D18EE2|nr:DUF4373 domain-containing protein [Granulicatella sp. zg-ZJ]NEW62615.1 DUF4373 domain-containing protein [Granulicatella sp. zg-ZJ]
MARPLVLNLKYFPLDVNFLSDTKIRRLKRECGTNGITVWFVLLTIIYGDKGYYVEYDDKLDLDISEVTDLSEKEVHTIIETTIKVNLFDEQIHKEHGILTSRGVQKRYIWSMQGFRRTKIFIEERLNLLKDTDVVETL